MDICLLTMVYMLYLYLVSIGLYWIEYFQLVYSYIKSVIIVIVYSLNGLAIANCSIGYQSNYNPISSIALYSNQLLISCYMYMQLIQLQLSNSNSIAIQLGLKTDRLNAIDHWPQSPPATIFL